MVPAAIVILAVATTAMIARLAAWACSSGDEFPGSLEDDLCDGVAKGPSSAVWWLAVMFPALVFGATQAVGRLRRHSLGIAIAVAALALVFWVTVGAIVIDVG